MESTVSAGSCRTDGKGEPKLTEDRAYPMVRTVIV